MYKIEKILIIFIKKKKSLSIINSLSLIKKTDNK